MISFSRDFEDPNVVVSRLEFGYDFDIFNGDAMLLSPGLGGEIVMGFLRFGFYLERF